MITEFWNGIAGGLATHWVAQVLTPAFVFWAGALLAWAYRNGWETFEAWWLGLAESPQVILLVAALIVVAVSAVVVQRFEYAVLRLLEGYWPGVLNGLRERRAEAHRRNLDEAKQKSKALLQKGLATLTADEQRELVGAERTVRNTPGDPRQVMPTELGNLLRSGERRVYNRYGLEPVFVWPRLWLLLPEQARKDVGEARGGLDTAVRALIWGLLFAVWTVWAWWALVIAIVVIIYAYRWAVSQAETYGDLFVSSFDLYRFELYEAVRWPAPKDSESEKAAGERLSYFLQRGFISPAVFYKGSGAKGR
jgi:hypothetical protein